MNSHPPPAPPLDLLSTYPSIAPCEHIAGNERFARKALALQQSHVTPRGRSLVDITLDLEDGAPIGQEEQLRQLFVALLHDPENRFNQVGVRVHSVTSEHFERDLAVILTDAAEKLAYITIPKVRDIRDVSWAQGLTEHFLRQRGLQRTIPLHLLIETPESLQNLRQLASLPYVETFDFGLMDFISHAAGAIPAACMQSPGQFAHPLLTSVKSALALAALGGNKIPSHNVTVDVRNPEQAYLDSFKARHEFGFLRMWSIHPAQVEPIVRGMTPSKDEALEAQEILSRAERSSWGPIEHNGRLHDRASYRYYWGLLQR
jgi:citrate lyase subunit beta/citryl-CoA lyase